MVVDTHGYRPTSKLQGLCYLQHSADRQVCVPLSAMALVRKTASSACAKTLDQACVVNRHESAARTKLHPKFVKALVLTHSGREIEEILSRTYDK